TRHSYQPSSVPPHQSQRATQTESCRAGIHSCTSSSSGWLKVRGSMQTSRVFRGRPGLEDPELLPLLLPGIARTCLKSEIRIAGLTRKCAKRLDSVFAFWNYVAPLRGWKGFT